MDSVWLAEEIETRYRKYLQTTFYFKDLAFREAFENALRSESLSRGPFLEATPVFKRGKTPAHLFTELLGAAPADSFLSAVVGARPLYQHQEEAIRSAWQKKNVVVATGTGSGKTESFLYPILLHLYAENLREKQRPGVRALVLYPMNALANDQRERLGQIATRLKESNSSFRFTFGQYIGETPENANDKYRNAGDHIRRRMPGEMVLRSEMRDTPPDILLTNYSMLEYLLLRPADTPLFDNGNARDWTFLVLDEAHQYRGSKGLEMAMLLRRLKQRLREGGREAPFRCIATSATLASGESGRTAVAHFASDLFDESFDESGIIFGEVEPIRDGGKVNLYAPDYEALANFQSIDSPDGRSAAESIAAKVGVLVAPGVTSATVVGAILSQDQRACRLRKLVTSETKEVKSVAEHIFDDLEADKRVTALSQLVELLVRARDPLTDIPLLAARYHVFFRSLEGAFISYLPQEQVALHRTSGDSEQAFFEIALCRECGQHYLVGRIEDNRLVEAVRDPSQDTFGAVYFRPVEGTEDGNDEDGNSSETERTSRAKCYNLCLQCGSISRNKLACGHDKTARLVQEEAHRDEDKATQLVRCGACGYTTGGRGPVREVVYGADGPNAVIATTLYRCLPEARRKILAFADGRQEAAFFAWYLEDSYREILHRNLLYGLVRQLGPEVPAGLSIRELAGGIRTVAEEWQLFPATFGELETRREAAAIVYREMLTDAPRISLEGVGLVRWTMKRPPWIGMPKILVEPPLSLSPQEADSVLFYLLDSMRSDRAVELHPPQTLDWQDLKLSQTQLRLRIGTPQANKTVRSWDGKRGRRAKLIAKLLMRRGLDAGAAVDRAVEVLQQVWSEIVRADESAAAAEQRLLLPLDDGRRLNPDWWRLQLVGPTDVLFRCNTCARIIGHNTGGICPRPSCRGSLEEVRRSELVPNHYRELYEQKLPPRMRVEEHTAQLNHEKAREFQREFKAGKIHVLSCSTTFELGVDLGDLDAVFLRNVPPEAFNYAQRVGRSGRRVGNSGFAVTYCRRSPHDLYHFAEPSRILSGKVRPPSLSMKNEKIVERHVAATALSAYFRAHPHRFKKLSDFCGDVGLPIGTADVQRYLLEHRETIESSIRHIVPLQLAGAMGLTDGRWIHMVAGKATAGEDGLRDSRLAHAEIAAASDYRNVIELEKRASDEKNYWKAGWAQRRATTIASEDFLAFLSRKAVIPKYGFPVDVVELDTQADAKGSSAYAVSLQRDLSMAIAEFAPTSQVIANKLVWSSYALKRVPEREWPRRQYKRCVEHNTFVQWTEGQEEPSSPCGHRLQTFSYVIPSFGFVTNCSDKPQAPSARPSRVFSTRPYFVRSLRDEVLRIQLPETRPLVEVQPASPGLMVVLCEGRRGEGFLICTSCGAGFRKLPKDHCNPYGDQCRGILEPSLSLGHEFVTDVLRLTFIARPDPKDANDWLAHSLGYAIVDGAAEVLEIPAIDLNSTILAKPQSSAGAPIVLYDNVPGGAGIVSRLEDPTILRAAIQSACERLRQCDCGDDTSCYGCLRNYRNQFAHPFLQRGPALRYLETILAAWM